MGILGILFLVLMLSFALGEVVRFEIIKGVFIKPIDILVFLTSLFWLIRTILLGKARNIYKDKLFAPIIIFFTVGLFSLVVNSRHLSLNEFFVSLMYAIRWILYASIYFVVKDLSFKNSKKILLITSISGILILTLGFIQYFFYSDLSNLYYLGWDEHMHRLFSTFLDPNFAGSFLVLFLAFISGITFFFLKNRNKKLAFILGFFAALALISIYLTYSRSALIMLFVSVLVFLILIKKIKWIFLLLITFFLFFLVSSPNFYIENMNPFRIASTEARIESAKTAFKTIEKNPLIGVGFNAYKYSSVRYGFKNPKNVLYSHADATTDNSFLFVLATTGLVGLASYIYLLFVILKQAYFRFKSSKKNDIQYYLSVVVIASFVGIIVDSMFINSLFYSFNLLWLWILVGVRENK